MHSIARRIRRFCSQLGCALALALALVFALGCAGEVENRSEPRQQVAASTREPRPADAPRVILISLDGVRHDYLDRDGLSAFDRLRKQGATAKRLLPVFPSITFPTHVSIATGTHADVHGIVGNQFWDSARGEKGEEYDYSDDANWLDAEPIWVAAERQGIPAAVFFWVGSETDWRGTGATHRKAPFDSEISEAEKVDQILDWLDIPTSNPTRPGLIMAYWRGSDHAGHRSGPESSAVDEALREQDAELGRLLDGLDERDAWPTTTLLVVSDHGMVEAGDSIDVKQLLSEAGIPARTVHAGAVAHIHLEDKSDIARTQVVLDGHAGVRAFATTDLPAELRYARAARTGDVVALAEAPYVFRSGRQSLGSHLLKATGSRPGMHGYDVREVPEMAGIFLAAGRGVVAGRALGDVRSIDVAATVAWLLEIEPPTQSEGQPIEFEAP